MPAIKWANSWMEKHRRNGIRATYCMDIGGRHIQIKTTFHNYCHSGLSTTGSPIYNN